MISTADAARKRRTRAGARPALGSVLVHAVVIAAAWFAASVRPEMPDFVSFQIDLVSMPAPNRGSPVVESPAAPQPPAPAEATPPPPAPEKVPAPAPTADKKAAPVKKSEPAKPTPKGPTTATGKATDAEKTTDKATGTESAEAINIRIEGLRRDYPAYYDNIILQIKRCFRWTDPGAYETEVYFVIEKDGGVSNMTFVRQSSNPSFNYTALAAVECAGGQGRLGSLPDDLPFDRLPIRFTFRPGNATGIFR